MTALSVKHRLTLDPPWTEMPPLRLGKLRTGAADLYITIAQHDRPVLRVDIYAGQETFAFIDAIPWGERVFVGYRDTVYVIDPGGKTGSAIALNTYFGSFFATAECLLAASGERLRRLSPSGSLLWTSQQLGLDGVVVNAIENGLIQGEGEWDPPGGWKSFAVSLDLGIPVV